VQGLSKAISHQWCDAHGKGGQAPLDLTEPRLETELTSADNVVAVRTIIPSAYGLKSF
jgi:hypothetical protein